MGRFAYIDESGDTGFKFNQGSTEHFVVALVLVEDPLPLQMAIDDLREQLSLPRRTEFRFNRTSDRFRQCFFEAVRKHKLIIRATYANKLLAVGHPNFSCVGDWYNFLVRLALIHHSEIFNDTTIVLDRRTLSKQAQRELNAYLRQAVNTPQHPARIREIRHEDSVKNNLLQTADMIAGAIAQSYARGTSAWLDMIRPMVREIRHWDGEIDP